MKADDLILFAQIAEMGSFSKVAEANELTNSVVSKRIARLEKELGTQLLYRTTRRLTLTEAGKALKQSAMNVKAAAQEAVDTISGYSEEVTGTIKMSVPTISGDLLLADAVAEFSVMHPGLSIDMSLDNRFVNLVEEGYDLVIRTGYLEDSSLIARHLLDSHWVVCTSPSYIRRKGQPKTPEDLRHHNCLTYSYHSAGVRDWEFVSSQRHYSVTVSGSFSSDNTAALRQAALNGHGIVYVPKCLVYPDLCNGKLIDLFPEQVGKVLGVYAVYPYSRQPARKIKLLIEHIRERYLAMNDYFER